MQIECDQKLIHNLNKEKQTLKNSQSSLKGSSQDNDDSLDHMRQISHNQTSKMTKINYYNKNKIKLLKKFKNNDQITDEDMKQLRKCIRNQFKKNNMLKITNPNHNLNKDEYKSFPKSRLQSQEINQIQGFTKSSKKFNTEQFINQFNNQEINQDFMKEKTKRLSPYEQNKRKTLKLAHNRSQSCPFIWPICKYHKKKTNYKPIDIPIPLSSKLQQKNLKLDKQFRKKISIQQLCNKRNHIKNKKATDILVKNQKASQIINNQTSFIKNGNHKYSNSLTQSNNTVIVHNLPNESSLLYNSLISNNLPTTTNLIQQNTLQNNFSNILTSNTPVLHFNNISSKNKNRMNTNCSEQTLNKNKKRQKKKNNSKCIKQQNKQIYLSLKQSLKNTKQMKLKFYIKNHNILKGQLNQKIQKYQLQQAKKELQIKQKALNIKQKIFKSFIEKYNCDRSQVINNLKLKKSLKKSQKQYQNSFQKLNFRKSKQRIITYFPNVFDEQEQNFHQNQLQ